MLVWSLLTGKAHIYVDSREIYRHEPVEPSVFNPFAASFHRGFDLPDHRHNGRHRLDIRCYARTPLGARNMVVNDSGETFRQYDLSVDGLSYFSMPAVYELGTDRMWEKVSRWGMLRSEGGEGDNAGGWGGGVRGGERRHIAHDAENDGAFEGKGRLVDEYYFDKASKRTSPAHHSYGRGGSISKSEHKAMSPRSESDEERMVRIATEASLREWEESRRIVRPRAVESQPRRGSSEENDGSYGNGRSKDDNNNRHAKRGNNSNKLTSIGEDDLIDFGDDDGTPKYVFPGNFERPADFSAMDDDITTASFAANAAWDVNGAPPPPRPPIPPARSSAGRLHPAQEQPCWDPTFRSQQPWSSAGTISSNPITPRGMMHASDASFAVPPPPTWDDYNNAFGGSSINAGVSNPMMSPMSTSSIGMASPMAQHLNQPMATTTQYGMQQAPQWQSQSFGPPGGGGGAVFVGGPSMGGASQMGSSANFDPMRVNPFPY
ncbi:hypothetical protein ACHAW5_011156 [Stephanodiscus triporus]|uniref:Galectin n=1 Tax=Stephanodiscus triporus TaxID=2934178 RepID=A0ABD3MU23_9STRA